MEIQTSVRDSKAWKRLRLQRLRSKCRAAAPTFQMILYRTGSLHPSTLKKETTELETMAIDFMIEVYYMPVMVARVRANSGLPRKPRR
jgi:hypothetical protein